MFRLEIIVFVSVVLVSVCTASMFFSHLPVHEETYVRHVNGRSRRDADKYDVSPFPRYRSFILTLEGKKVRLDLKLNERHNDKVRVNLFNNGKVKNFEESAPRDYAFYQQIRPESRVAVMVKCNNRKVTACHIVGNIQIGENTYKIEPKTQEGTLVSKVKHVVYKAQTGSQKDTDYEGDTKTLTIDDSELEQHLKIKRATRPKLHSGAMTDEIQETRQKRQAGQVHHKIELSLVADNFLYDYWFRRAGDDESAAVEMMKQYYEVMVNDMDTRYITATTSDMKIDIILLQLNIMQDSFDAPWIFNSFVTSNGWVDASESLDKFRQWAETASDVGKYDVIMALTSRDLASYSDSAEQYRNGTVGLAYRFNRQINGVTRPLALPCRRLRTVRNGPLENYAAVIVEDLSGGDVAHTMAHEVAHVLGVAHDGSGNGCTFQDQFIMASGRYRSYLAQADPGNQWTFSPCSINMMSMSLQDLVADNENCLQEDTYDVIDYERIKNLPKSGDILPINEQCKIAVDLGSYFCNGLTRNMTAICQTGVYCFLPWTSNVCQTMHVMDGTDCSNAGENKVCKQGSCVDRDVVPTTSTTVPPTTSTTTPSTSTATTTIAPTTRTTTTPTTTTTTPTTTTTTPTTTTTTPTTTTTTPTTTTTTPTTTTTTPTTTTTTPTTTTTTPTTTTTTTTPTTTTIVSTTTSTTLPPTTTPQTFNCDIYCRICLYYYQRYNGYIWSGCPGWLKTLLQIQP